MTEPRKKKRKTGRPLEKVPMRTLLKRVRKELEGKLETSLSDESRKQKQE